MVTAFQSLNCTGISSWQSFATQSNRWLQERKIQLTALAALVTLGVGYILGAPLTFMVTFSAVSTVALVTLVSLDYLRRVSREREVNSPEPIDFSLLEPYLLSPEKLKNYETEIEQGEYQSFLKLIELVLEGGYLEVFKKTHAFSWFLPQLRILIEREALSDEICTRLHEKLSQAQIFNDYQETVEITCRDDKKLKVKKFALLLASPYHRRQYLFNLKNGQPSHCHYPEESFITIKSFVNYIHASKTTFLESNATVVDFVDLLNLFRSFLLKDLEATVKNLLIQHVIKTTESIKEEEDLETFLKSIFNCKAKINDPELFAGFQCKAVSELYKNKYHTLTPFYLEENCFTIPLTALHLLERPGVLADYLKENVNCISLPIDCQEVHVTKLVLFGKKLDKFTALAFPLNAGFSSYGCAYSHYVEYKVEYNDLTLLDKIIALVPHTHTLYTSPAKGFDPLLNYKSWKDRTREPFGDCLFPKFISEIAKRFPDKSIKISLNSDLLNFNTQKIHVLEETQSHFFSQELFKTVEFVNLSSHIQLWLGYLNSNEYVPRKFPEIMSAALTLNQKNRAQEGFTFKVGDGVIKTDPERAETEEFCIHLIPVEETDVSI